MSGSIRCCSTCCPTRSSSPPRPGASPSRCTSSPAPPGRTGSAAISLCRTPASACRRNSSAISLIPSPGRTTPGYRRSRAPAWAWPSPSISWTPCRAGSGWTAARARAVPSMSRWTWPAPAARRPTCSCPPGGCWWWMTTRTCARAPCRSWTAWGSGQRLPTPARRPSRWPPPAPPKARAIRPCCWTGRCPAWTASRPPAACGTRWATSCRCCWSRPTTAARSNPKPAPPASGAFWANRSSAPPSTTACAAAWRRTNPPPKAGNPNPRRWKGAGCWWPRTTRSTGRSPPNCWGTWASWWNMPRTAAAAWSCSRRRPPATMTRS